MKKGTEPRAQRPSTPGAHPARPLWNADERVLYAAGRIVKRFRRPAANQMLILEAFQEQGWRRCIDDPLPHGRHTDPKRRLHDTIKQLNRNQTNPLILFHGDGTGTAICWEWAAGKAPLAPPDLPQLDY